MSLSLETATNRQKFQGSVFFCEKSQVLGSFEKTKGKVAPIAIHNRLPVWSVLITKTKP